MDFFIKKNSVLPILKMRLVKDGRNDFRHFWEMMENCAITFSMKDTKTNVYKVANVAGELIQKTPISGNTDEEYYIAYRWQTGDTNEMGVFIGEFNIKFFDANQNNLEIGDLKVPIRDTLYIHIIDSFTFSTVI
jgi:hypothetical protein